MITATVFWYFWGSLILFTLINWGAFGFMKHEMRKKKYEERRQEEARISSLKVAEDKLRQAAFEESYEYKHYRDLVEFTLHWTNDQSSKIVGLVPGYNNFDATRRQNLAASFLHRKYDGLAYEGHFKDVEGNPFTAVIFDTKSFIEANR